MSPKTSISPLGLGLLACGTIAQGSGFVPVETARQLYPEAVAGLEAACPSPSSLRATAFQNPGQPERAQFICWSAPDANGARVGQWLGNLPLTAADPTFASVLACPAGDSACETQVEALQAAAPDILAAAEFACGMKDGSLFLASAADATDIRCGHFATTYWDTNGDGTADHSDAVSVDLSVGQVLP